MINSCWSFLCSHWLICSICIAVLILSMFPACRRLLRHGSFVSIVIYFVVLVALVVLPFCNWTDYPQTVKNLLSESVDTCRTEEQKSADGKIVVAIVRNETKKSRAPAVFVLVFACLMYFMLFCAILAALVDAFKVGKRTALMEANVEKMLSLLLRLNDEKAIKNYQEKIISKYISIFLDDQED